MQAEKPVIYVDADACPVKNEVLKVAERHGLKTVFVAVQLAGQETKAWARLGDRRQVEVALCLKAAFHR